jgi:hypothetical protein
MNTKRLADLITFGRAAGAPMLAGWVLAGGPATAGWAAAFLLVDWAGDLIDGALARRTPSAPQTWIGEHDLEVDMWVAAWLLAYLGLAGLVNLALAVLYLAGAGLLLAAAGWPRSLGMVCQAPIYVAVMIIAVQRAPLVAVGLFGWPVLVVALTWPRFPRVVVPQFLAGFRQLRPPAPGSHSRA